MTARIFKLPFFLAFVASILFGCQGDEGTIRPAKEAHTYNLKGYVQKGPFINGTTITISELDQKLVATGKNFTTQTTDNKGSFSLEGVELQSNFVQLMANGFYFDEVSGEKSAAPLTLFALADTSAVSSVNINLLSHLEKDRVIHLMQNEEKSFATAKQQAQQEILTIFGIKKADIAASERLDISQDGDDNAILLAISAILQGNNTVAELSELLADIITDIREDGVLDSESTREKIRANAMSLALADVRQHLEVRYEELGVDAAIANFEQYVDSDGDGFLNKNDDNTPDDFTLEAQIDVAVNTVVVSNEVVVSGLKEGGKAIAYVESGMLSGSKASNDSIYYPNEIEVNLIVNNHIIDNQETEVVNGDRIQIALRSSYNTATITAATLTIGLTTRIFEVTTSPDPIQELTSFPGEASHHRVYFSIDEYVYVGMGMWYDQTSSTGTHISNRFYRYNTNVWSEISSFPGKIRLYAVGFVVLDKGYVGLGLGNERSYDYLQDLWSYDPLQDSWHQISSFPGEGRQEASSFVIDNNAYIGLGVGYEASDGEKFLDDFWRFDPLTETWSQIANFGGEPRVRAFAFSINGKGFIGKGELKNFGETDDLWEYDPTTDQWIERADLSIANEEGIGFGLRNKGYAIFGYELSIHQYSPNANKWTTIKENRNFYNSFDVGLSTQEKGYLIDTENNFYEFTPPQD